MQAQATPESYDPNFCFPLRDLSNERVRLTPFIPSIHAGNFFAQTSTHPELYIHNGFGPFASVTELVDVLLEGIVHPDRGIVFFAVFDKTPSGEKIAGLLGYTNTSPQNLSTEIGYIMTIPTYQRTHVTSNAVGLLLEYALDLPSKGGLGLRRVQWQASASNTASLNAAKKMFFQPEGVKRWDRVYPEGKAANGLAVGEGRGAGVGRDTAVFSICWNDWEGGTRDKVKAVMERTK